MLFWGPLVLGLIKLYKLIIKMGLLASNAALGAATTEEVECGLGRQRFWKENRKI